MSYNKSSSRFLVGNRLYLRPVEPEDIPSICRWINDPEIRKLTGEILPLSTKQAADFLDKIYAEKERVWFSVVLRENNYLIGECGLLRMFHPWRTTDLTLIIGEKEYWHKGYGTEAMNLLLEYAFGHLNFHRVAVGVVGFNENAIRFYKKIGFKEEGVQRDGYYFNHHYYDFVMMSMLEDEYSPCTRRIER